MFYSGYWNDGRNEVDLVAVYKKVFPVEVKYQASISDSDFKGLRSFLEKHKLKRGVLVTKNLLKVKKDNGVEIHCIPAWLFLLCL